MVARGTVIGQAPFVLATPLIARLFPATELGIYGVAFAFVGIAAPVVGLRFELAAISARDDHDARLLLILSALAILPVTCAAVLTLGALKLLNVGAYGALSWWLVAVTGLVVAAAGAYSTLRCGFAREGRFNLVARSLTVQGLLRAALPLLLAPVAATAAVLLVGELAARASSVLLMAWGRGLRQGLGKLAVSAQSLRIQARRYWKYPLLLAPSALVDAAATLVPVPILATYYGLGPAGKFALVQRLVMLPAGLIVGSVGDVFHAHAATVADSRTSSVSRLVRLTAGRLLLLALLVYLPTAVLALLTAQWIFGEQWADAGPIIAVLTPLCIAQTTVSPISRGLLLSGREEWKLLADAACLVLPVAALYLARKQPMLTAIACLSGAATVAYMIYFGVILHALRNSAVIVTDTDDTRPGRSDGRA
jgi:O-antigen/teichoic acid export membrane protein